MASTISTDYNKVVSWLKGQIQDGKDDTLEVARKVGNFSKTEWAALKAKIASDEKIVESDPVVKKLQALGARLEARIDTAGQTLKADLKAGEADLAAEWHRFVSLF
jgi:hypothetical protein